MYTLSDFLALPPATRKSIINLLSQAHRVKQSDIHYKKSPSVDCPFCKANAARKNGHSPSGIERYQCKSCNLTFSNRTGTALHAIKLEDKFLKFTNIMLEGYKPLKTMAAETGISVSTAFQWRHKVLCSFKNSTSKFVGITDLDTKKFPFSRKGLKSKLEISSTDEKAVTHLITVADFFGNTEQSVVGIGVLKHEFIPAELKDRLLGEAIIVAPAKKTILKYAQHNPLGITLYNPEKSSRKFNVENADSMDEKTKSLLLTQMHGVSSKYLNRYALWSQHIHAKKKLESHEPEALLKNTSTWGQYVNTEDSYQQFLQNKSNLNYIKAYNRQWNSAKKFC